jgi:hypothetical protein
LDGIIQSESKLQREYTEYFSEGTLENFQNFMSVWHTTNKIFVEGLTLTDSVLSDSKTLEKTENTSKIRQCLKERDYSTLFKQDTSSESIYEYTKRYIPSRVLCYLNNIITYKPLITKLLKSCHVVNIGGGSCAEAISFITGKTYVEKTRNKEKKLYIQIYDISPYNPIIESLRKHSNNSTVDFKQQDILEDYPDLKGVTILTMHYIVNELFQMSKQKANAFLDYLFLNMERNSVFWVLDCASDVSAIKVNGKDYPVYFILDFMAKKHNLNVLSAVDSEWYRVDKALVDAVPTLRHQNMRYFQRIYCKPE